MTGPEVDALLERLATLSSADWARLQDAHARTPTRDAAEEALAQVLVAHGLRDEWFELRSQTSDIARKAAADYAAATGEGIRTIEHVASFDGWDGQHEASKLEVLRPVHERGFIDAGAAAVGIMLMRPYLSKSAFDRFWKPYRAVLG